MGQQVKFPDEIVNDVRAVAPFAQRGIASQIEFRTRHRKSIEPLHHDDRASALLMARRERPLSEFLSEVETAKRRRRFESTLNKRLYVQHKAVLDHPNLVCCVEEHGRESTERFADCEKKVVEAW